MSQPRPPAFNPGGGLAMTVIVMLLMCMLLDLVYAAALWPSYQVASREVAGEVVTEDERFTAGMILVLPTLAKLLLYFATVVVFCVWIHRAHKNLQALRVQHLQYSPGWAVGYYFVPFLNLVRPMQVMQEIWHGSVAPQPGQDAAAWKFASTPTLIGGWWGAWILTNIIGQVSFRLYDPAKPKLVLFSYKLDVAAGLLSIVAAGLLICLVKGINKRQNEHFRQLTSIPAGVRPPGTGGPVSPVPQPSTSGGKTPTPSPGFVPDMAPPPESNPYDLTTDPRTPRIPRE